MFIVDNFRQYTDTALDNMDYVVKSYFLLIPLSVRVILSKREPQFGASL